VNTGGPLFTQIRIKLALARCPPKDAFCSFGKARGGDRALHGFPAHPKKARNGTLPQALSVQSYDLFIASNALVPADLLFAFSIRQAREISLCAGLPLVLF
jgi:hypothetical protein